MRIEPRLGISTKEAEAAIPIAPGHDHAAHALRNISAIASFYESGDDAVDALEAIITIAERGLSLEVRRAG